jgi:hypothetical protein
MQKMEIVLWLKLHNKWINRFGSIQLLSTSTQGFLVATLIEVSWQMNDSMWFSSIILSLPCNITEFLTWSKSPQKLMILRGSLQLFCHVDPKPQGFETVIQCILNEQIYLTVFNYLQLYSPSSKMHSCFEITCYLNKSRWFTTNILHSRSKDAEILS